MTSNTPFLRQLLDATVRDTPAFGGTDRTQPDALDLDALADEAWTQATEPTRIAKAAKFMRDRTGLGLREIVPVLRKAEDRAAGRPERRTLGDLAAEHDDLRKALTRLVELNDAPGSFGQHEAAWDDARTVLARTSGGAA